MQSHDSVVTVRYAETDAMGVVHHASYLVWFEVARTEWLAAQGYRYADFERRGFFLVVSEIGVTYRRPARYGDEVRVRSRPSELRSRAIRFDYEVFRVADETRLVRGFSRHILTDQEGAIRTFPADVLAILQRKGADGGD